MVISCYIFKGLGSRWVLHYAIKYKNDDDLSRASMKRSSALLTVSLFILLTFLPSFRVMASGGFEPSKRICLNVDKEISRVSDEVGMATSNIQKSWLLRQLTALETKRSSCSINGFGAVQAENCQAILICSSPTKSRQLRAGFYTSH